MALQTGVVNGDGWTYLQLAGAIDQESDLLGVSSGIRGPDVLADLSAVHRMDVTGARDWVAWVRSLGTRGATLTLVGCSPAVVTQLNLVDDVGRGVRVAGFQAPYFCERCEREEIAHLAVSDLDSPPRRAPSRLCGTCGEAMIFDDIEQSYFAFLERVVRAPLPDASTRAVARAMEALEAGVTELPPETPTPAAPRMPQHPVEGSSPSLTAAHGATGSSAELMSRSDVLFYVAVGILTALLGVVIFHALAM